MLYFFYDFIIIYNSDFDNRDFEIHVLFLNPESGKNNVNNSFY